MPRTEYEAQGSEKSPNELRHRAARVRQLARELVNQDDAERMKGYAKELEERAKQVEAGEASGQDKV